MKNSVTVQIYTGGFESPPEPLDVPLLIGKLEKILQKAEINCVMIGWNPNANIGGVVNFCKWHGIDVYLWLPVFSGLKGLSPLIGPNGNPVKQAFQAEKGERFDFGCPANPDNLRRVKQNVENRFSGVLYDGVFLDKIRFPSFICGLEPMLTCFCPYCLPLHGLSDELALARGDNPLGINLYSQLRYELEDEALARLFVYKADVITAAAADLSGHFRQKGFKVGLDLFAPFLSFFVGQDYGRLAPYADFIKPMFYRRTNAPAGIPFEFEKMLAAFGGDVWVRNAQKRFLRKAINTKKFTNAFINREIKGIRDQIGAVKLYAGVEINYLAKTAPVTAGYIRESISSLKGADGFALSWDLSSISDENLDAALNAL
ncbi:MAG: hypothetical protein FWG31_00660 [Oscillospiraceae bacterium]|nr:hypothetical protein [Oscillospiraceae bacterium]